MQPLLAAIPTNIITGFLGAGKTTLIQQLLANKPANERWAVLVNEFGQIGIDQALMASQDEVFIKEVAGGCICCANFLPMQVALSQLLAKSRPQRLLIEPTGLGHPRQILESLSESHWQSTLQLRATLCVIDARQYQDERVQQHESFIAQAEVADVLVFSKNDVLNDSQRQSVQAFAEGLPPPQRQQVFVAQGQLDFALLDAPRRENLTVKRSLLHQKNLTLNAPTPKDIVPPYHYHHQALEMFVGGWVFPADWQFQHNGVLDVLLALQVQRIKGVVHTSQGWLNINITPWDMSMTSRGEGADNRLEIISQQSIDWEALELALMAIKS